MDQYLERVVDLTEPTANQIYNMTAEQARELLLHGPPEKVREIEGSFALVARAGKTVKLARSLDRPMRYFLAKRTEGPALVVAHRIDTIRDWLVKEGFGDQFHPNYTRMVPAHYVVGLQLIGCPDPDPTYTRFFNPQRNALSTDLDEIGHRYTGALTDEIAKWLGAVDGGARLSPAAAAMHGSERTNSQTLYINDHAAAGNSRAPSSIGVCFSGGIDSGAVFLTTYHVMKKLGMNLGRLKAFTLNFGDGPDIDQAKKFLDAVGLGLFLEPIEADLSSLDVSETIRVIEDYKLLDVECATMGLALCRGIRTRYPDWRYLLDGDGGDENLKDYPIEENPELTIRSVVNNRMLYQEGWGVGTIKHSLTYSGGLSRSYTRTYAPAHRYGFTGFSPFTRPNVVEVAEGIPFIDLTEYNVTRLYSLKGEIVSRGVKAITGFDMPVFEKRRFQHGAVRREALSQAQPFSEHELRQNFLSIYA